MTEVSYNLSLNQRLSAVAGERGSGDFYVGVQPKL
jgi:hypothetical protein